MRRRDSFLVSKEEINHPLKRSPASAREKESLLARLFSKFAKMKHNDEAPLLRQWISYSARFGYM